MIYDRFGVPAICRGCGATTYWYIEGEYPLCPKCALELVIEIDQVLEGKDVEKIVEEENKIICRDE